MELLVRQLKFLSLATLLVAIGTPISHAEQPLLAVPGLEGNFKAASPVVRPVTVKVVPKLQAAPVLNPVDNEALQLGLLPSNDQALPPAPAAVAQPPPQVFVPMPVSRPAAASDSQLEAGIQSPGTCPYADGRCYRRTRAAGLRDQSADIKKVAEAQNASTDSDLLSKLGAVAVREAVKDRSVAKFCGGGHRSGNRSKCACAAGVKDTLLSTGICTSRPPGDAINLAGFRYSGTTAQLRRTGPDRSIALTAFCPALHQTHGREHKYRSSITAALRAPAGSVIVYSTSRHGYGHIEIKIKVTAQNIRQISHNLRVKVGDYLYCSDFCRAGPTFSHGTNRVEAIYSL